MTLSAEDRVQLMEYVADRIAAEMMAEIRDQYGSLYGACLISIPDAARILGVSTSRARQLLKDNLVELGDRHQRVRWGDVDLLILQRS